jgi:ribosomal protein L11 methyltransferase
MAFGTGGHASTSLCLATLDQLELKNDNILDMGTGSGILAIASILLGAKSVDAVEIDKVAIEVAKKNAKLNKINNNKNKTINFIQGNFKSIPNKNYKTIIANITADVHIENFHYYIKFLSKNGNLLLSGISDYRQKEFENFLKTQALKQIKHSHKDGWNTYLYKAII